MSSVTRLRPAGPRDADFLGSMLVAAVNWSEDHRGLTPAEVMADALLAAYVTDWPRAGEAGVVAEADEPLGAAWWRRFPSAAPGFGFVDAETPEIAIGVVPGARGMGLGARLLEGLVARARDEGLAALSLSVRSGNRRAIRLYQRVGFVTVGHQGQSQTMRLGLQPAGPEAPELRRSGRAAAPSGPPRRGCAH